MARRDPLQAIITYERAAAQVTDLTRRIGVALELCPIAVEANTPDGRGFYNEKLLDGARVKTHLWHAFRETTDADAPYPSERRLIDWELTEYLEEQRCPHCAEAWELIKARKVARRSFGDAKRAIRSIGRNAIKKEPPHA